MRTLFLLTVSFLALTTADAQRVAYKNDFILVDGAPYARMSKKDAPAPAYTLAAADGESFLTVVYDVDAKDYVATFVASGTSTRLRSTAGFGTWLARQVVDARLVVDGKFSGAAGERRFLAAHRGMAPPLPTEAAPVTPTVPGGIGQSAAGPALVPRDRTRPITVMGNEITQDFTVIGTYSTRTTEADSVTYTVYTFALPDGTAVAEATTEGAAPKLVRIATLNDNRETMVSLQEYDRFTLVKGMAQYLVRRAYL